MLEPKLPYEPDRRGAPEAHRLVFGNRILDSLPPKDAERLAPAMRRVFLQRDQVVVRPGEPIAFLHFPIDMFAWSWTETTDTQRPTSVLTVGQRGVVEWNRVLATELGNTCATIISPGAAWRLSVETFEQYHPNITSPLRRLLLRFANASLLNAACRLACNAEHNIDQRLARWLLWVSDECGRLEFAITHQQIAEIAAIRRPSVSLALSQFQRDGLVRSQHGRMRILERERLEEMVCRCYWIIRNNSDGVFKGGGT
ncbi:MAG TPA: Crp/Fnr family transcriptional regulator [Candidatus Baltobacteraceae bacterium]|nr:Crp/Fnr family transcriptional regulator [Candidatus Baltobacteraceae bacterium]